MQAYSATTGGQNYKRLREKNEKWLQRQRAEQNYHERRGEGRDYQFGCQAQRRYREVMGGAQGVISRLLVMCAISQPRLLRQKQPQAILVRTSCKQC
eukprot:11065178-Karenia_brevis.AAC.1